MVVTAAIRRAGRVRRWLALAGFGAAVAAVAATGGLAASNAPAEYRSLRQPSWAPPAWLFGPVWTALYVMIALSGWLLWCRAGMRPALAWYAVQLLLNAAWAPLFFGAGRYELALADLAALWVAIGVTVALFWRRSRTAALLLVPYWAWVTFAGALNGSIVRLN